MHRKTPQSKTNIQQVSGFTIIEVTLSLMFISILLLSVIFVAVHLSTIYQKGNTMNAINSTSRLLVDDFQRGIATAPARSLSDICRVEYASNTNEMNKCLQNQARKYVYQQNYGTIKAKQTGKLLESVPLSGVFCSGRYTYLWNTGYVLNSTDYEIMSGSRATFSNGDTEIDDYRLIKIEDSDRAICRSHMEAAANNNRVYQVADIAPTYRLTGAEYKEVMKKNNEDIALYDFTIFAPTEHALTMQNFYSGTFILATLRGNVDITGTGEFCKTPPEMGLSSSFNYCAINKFNFSARTSGQNRKGEE